MGAYTYDNIAKFLPYKVNQVNLYFSGYSGSDLFAIKQLLEGSSVTIEPLTEATDNGFARTVAYNINCTFQFFQNDFPSYAILMNRASYFADYLTNWTAYIKFDDYTSTISISMDNIPAPQLKKHNIEQKLVDTGNGIMLEYSINTVISALDFDFLFATIA